MGILEQLSLAAHTVRGPIQFEARAARNGHEVRVSLPDGCAGEVLLRPDSSSSKRELLAAGQAGTFWTSSGR